MHGVSLDLGHDTDGVDPEMKEGTEDPDDVEELLALSPENPLHRQDFTA